MLVEEAHKRCLETLGRTVLGYRTTSPRDGSPGQIVPSIADSGNSFSLAIAEGIFTSLKRDGISLNPSAATEQNEIGSALASALETFLDETLNGPMQRLRTLNWDFQAGGKISTTAQYRHLEVLERLLRNPDRVEVHAANTGPVSAQKRHEEDIEVRAALAGNYTVKPDLLVLRPAVNDDLLNPAGGIPAVSGDTGRLAHGRREMGAGKRRKRYPLLHANVSFKWTVRSDRAQNVRTEALQLIRQRRGPMPQMVAVTAEPLPSRLASLALGTGEVDALYHVSLDRLLGALEVLAANGPSGGQASEGLQAVKSLRDAGRLKDLADLPIDLAS